MCKFADKLLPHGGGIPLFGQKPSNMTIWQVSLYIWNRNTPEIGSYFNFCLICPLVDGGLSNWSAWGTCTFTCGTGTRTRTRTCTKPSPQYGGKDCTGLGDKQQQENCNAHNCPGKVHSHPG